MNPETNTRPKKGDDETPASPYGPHPHGVDEAAGGADSSPYETESSDARKDTADEEIQKGRNTTGGPDNQTK